MPGLLELLHNRGLPRMAKVKIARHKDTRYDLDALIARGHFEEGYQAYQSRPVFHDCDYVISCIGLPGLRARFFGVYRVAGRRAADQVVLPPHLEYLRASDPVGWSPEGLRGGHWYELVRVDLFEDLENRVVIDWGPGARRWVQWARLDRDKQILEKPE